MPLVSAFDGLMQLVLVEPPPLPASLVAIPSLAGSPTAGDDGEGTLTAWMLMAASWWWSAARHVHTHTLSGGVMLL